MWKSPIDIFRTEIEMHVEADVIRAVSKYGVNVDKDELFKLLRGDRESYERGYDDGYDAGFNADKWIPCSERLPNDGTDCLVTVKMKYDHETEYEENVDIATYYDGDWCTSNDWFEGQQYYKILAWMPLPQPYKGE